MGCCTVLICVIGMLAFMSMVRAQDPHGTPGVDYPNFFTIPETSFKCSEQKYNPGFYADLETKCQAFHFCYQDRQESFLCPTGTIFNQQVLTCDVWYKSNCSLAHMFYSVNAGPVMERAGKNLPMLLRLRNRSQSKLSVQKSTSSVYEKESNLHETGNETPSKTPSSPKDEMSKTENREASIVSSKDFDKNEQASNSNENSDEREEIGKDEFSSEGEDEMDENVVYDTVNDGYYRDYDRYESEWQDDEPVNDEFNSFYEYTEPGNVYGADERESLLKYYINKAESSENSETVVDGLNYPEFAKRNSQTGHYRVRRKPIYVLNDQPEIESGTDLEPDAAAQTQSREGKEMNITSEAPVEESTPKPEPFPRPTAIPHHLLNISSETPMTSEEFENAIVMELVFPGGVVPDDHPQTLLYPLPPDNQTTSEQTSSQSPDTQSDDETIYIQDDVEPENYVPYDSQYVETDLRDTDDTFVVIPDEYDNVDDSVSEAFEMQSYPQETMHRSQMVADRSQVSAYDTYDNSYRYSPSVGYPQHVVQANYRDQFADAYQSFVPFDQRYSYERDYELSDQPLSYENFDYGADNAYTQTEQFPYSNVVEKPLELPVAETEIESLEDFNEVADPESIEGPEEIIGQPEDVYYVLDLDEESSTGNSTKMNEEDKNMKLESSLEEFQANERDHDTKEINSSNDESVSTNVSLDRESAEFESSQIDEGSNWSPNSQNGHVKTSGSATSNMDIDKVNTLSGSNVQGNQQMPPVYENLAPSFPTNMDNFDFSTDSRFLNNMGYSESMDFGPYGFGPNMGQQFSMMESTQHSKAANPFTQRMGQTEQPKLSPLSAIQEKMRSMKQGKFGAFKKYMSSTM